MTAEQWVRVRNIFERGADLDADARNVLLATECADDTAVAEQVRLLWRDIQAGADFLEHQLAGLRETGQITRAMLERGRLVGGRFTVLELIGAGGMGEVYRARDERLGRMVALKVLAQRRLNRPEYRARLEHEARAVSSLAHPRICALYDVGTDGELTYLVMELLEGEPLSARIARGRLPLDELLGIALQITEGLEYAHKAGVVHRDLKPVNVMLSDAGVKLLDFGIAKRTAAAGSGTDQSTVTSEGQIIGTVAYMSPEQAEGRSVDARSDIFSLGSILYEMATGRRPFQRDSSLSTLAAILRDQPPTARKLMSATPAELDALIQRCLAKNPDRRPATAAEVRSQLEKLSDGLRSRRARWRAPLITSGLAVLLGMAVFTWLIFSRRPAEARYQAPLRVTVEAGNARYPALSRDGKLLAYASDRAGNFDIYVQQIDGKTTVRLTSSPHNEVAPSFTPDGKYIVFQSDQEGAGLQVISSQGGESRVLANEGFRPRVSPDGSQVLYWTGPWGDTIFGEGSKIHVIPLNGGSPRTVHPEFFAAYPIWLDDGRHILFAGNRERSTTFGKGWWVSLLDESPPKPIGSDTAIGKLGEVRSTPLPGFAHAGAVYGSAQIGDTYAIIALRFNPEAAEMRSTASRVVDNFELVHDATASARGLLSFAVITGNYDLYRLRLDPLTHQVSGGPERLTHEPSQELIGSLSEDGRMLAYVSNRDGNFAVWVRDLQQGQDRRIAAVPRFSFSQISPDGRNVAFNAADQNKTLTVAPTRGGELSALASEAQTYPYEWMSSETLRTMHWDQMGERYQFIDMSVPARKVIWTSSWMSMNAGCSPERRLEWCTYQTPGTIRFSARSRSPGAPEYTIAVLSSWPEIVLTSEREDFMYWQGLGQNADVLWGRKIDPATGGPRGEPLIVYRFSGPARPGNRNMQGLTLRNGSVVLTLRETKSNIWLQQLPE
jgi:tRNA A-37 threonylcarbamoyl transferase component Bud32